LFSEMEDKPFVRRLLLLPLLLSLPLPLLNDGVAPSSLLGRSCGTKRFRGSDDNMMVLLGVFVSQCEASRQHQSHIRRTLQYCTSSSVGDEGEDSHENIHDNNTSRSRAGADVYCTIVRMRFLQYVRENGKVPVRTYACTSGPTFLARTCKIFL